MREAAQVAAKQAEETGGLGRPGRPIDRRSPFFIGMAAAAGVAVTYGLVELFVRARSVLILIGVALFIAAGLDPMVSWLTRRGCRGGRPWSSCSRAARRTAGVRYAGRDPAARGAGDLAGAAAAALRARLQNHNSELGR